MSHLVVDNQLALEALERRTAAVAELLRSAPTPTATAIGHWSVRDVASHMSHVWSVIEGCVRGTPSPVQALADMSPHYEKEVDDDPEYDLGTLADRLEERTASYAETARDKTMDDTGVWHAGIVLPVPVLTSVLLGEALVHGFDIARGSKQGWKLPRAEAAINVEGLSHLLPYFVNEERAENRRIRFRIHVRGGANYDVVVDDGALRIAPPGKGVDCHISADPGRFILMGYNRIGQVPTIARGAVFAYGKKPWLGLELTKILRVP